MLMTEGIEHHQLGERSVPITSPARTVADCFKHRNRIGLDVALEALKELLKRDHNSVGEITRYSKMNRVDQILIPYMTASL